MQYFDAAILNVTGCTFVQEVILFYHFTILSLRRSFSLVRTHCASPRRRYNADLYLS